MALRAAIVGYMARRLRQLERKTPGSFPPGAVVQANFTLIRRSGKEVAMDAEARRPVVHVGHRARSNDARRTGDTGVGRDQVARQLSRLLPLVQHVESEIGGTVKVPLSTR